MQTKNNPKGCNYSHLLEDTSLGIFKQKLMTKFEIMLQKLRKCQKVTMSRQPYNVMKDPDFDIFYEN